LSVEIDGAALDEGGYVFTASGLGGLSSPLYASLSFEGDTPLPDGGTLTVKVKAGYKEGECPQDIIQWMLVKITGYYEQRAAFATGANFYEFSPGFVDHLLHPYLLP
jgi:hypothetical protein